MKCHLLIQFCTGTRSILKYFRIIIRIFISSVDVSQYIYQQQIYFLHSTSLNNNEENSWNDGIYSTDKYNFFYYYSAAKNLQYAKDGCYNIFWEYFTMVSNAEIVSMCFSILNNSLYVLILKSIFWGYSMWSSWPHTLIFSKKIFINLAIWFFPEACWISVVTPTT